MTVLTNGMAVYPPRLYDLVREQEAEIADLKQTLERTRRYNMHWMLLAHDNLEFSTIVKAELAWIREEMELHERELGKAEGSQ